MVVTRLPHAGLGISTELDKGRYTVWLMENGQAWRGTLSVRAADSSQRTGGWNVKVMYPK